jgi:hypothetical protein
MVSGHQPISVHGPTPLIVDRGGLVGVPTLQVVPRRRVPGVDRYPGPDAVWRFYRRNRRTLLILGFGVLLFGVGWLVIALEGRGRCAGYPPERSAVAELRQDPLLTAVPPGATSTVDWYTSYSCATNTRDVTRGVPPPPTMAIAFEIRNEYRLGDPLSVVALYNQYAPSANAGGWRLTHTDDKSLSYCRVFGRYRLVDIVTVDDRRLWNQIVAWTDGAQCGADVAAPR